MEFDFGDGSKEEPKAPTSNIETFSVSEISGAIKRTVEGRFSRVRLRGEISGYRGPHSSGHAYFSLKDEKARIDAVVWRGVFSRLQFKPEEGVEVIATGKISTFGGKSSYQIIIDQLEPAGEGALMALLKKRKAMFEKEGVFDPARKKPLPFLPRVVGIVTSPTGAVIRDMMHGFDERFPVHVLLWPVRVQGETSAAEVARAIDGFNKFERDGDIPRPDVLIVARGGGSLEDLWGFNDEAVVRAASASQIPIISAIGHETDWTLLDLVADDRAPTPTKAAERAVPKFSDLSGQLADYKKRILNGISRHLSHKRTEFGALSRVIKKASDLFASPRQNLDLLSQRLNSALGRCTHIHRRAFSEAAGRFAPALLSNRLQMEQMKLTQLKANQYKAILNKTGQERQNFNLRAGRLQPLLVMRSLTNGRDKYMRLRGQLTKAMIPLMDQKRRQLNQESKLLRSLGYKNVLKRGFVLVRNDKGQMVRSHKQLKGDQSYELEFADGRACVKPLKDELGSQTIKTHKPAKAAPSKKAKSAHKTRENRAEKRSSDDQGSLF